MNQSTIACNNYGLMRYYLTFPTAHANQEKLTSHLWTRS
jgi:hypothetical protein